jgi:type I restriction enzyme S subunit
VTTFKIGDVTELVNGFAFDSKHFNQEGVGMPVVRIRDVVRGRTDTFYSGNYSKHFVVNTGDLLIGMDGEFNIAPWRSRPALLNQRVCKIRAIPELADNTYLRYRLTSVLKKLEDDTPYVTVKHLSSKRLQESGIELPPLPEQKRIAAILDKADRLRRLRRYALNLSDTFLPAVFLQMFGDPVTNPMGWPVKKLGDLVDGFEGGVNFPPVSDGDAASDWRVLKVSAVTWGSFDASQSKPIQPDVQFDDSLIVKQGDLIFSRANTTELVGAVSMVRTKPSRVLLPDKLWRIKLPEDSELQTDFLLYVLRQQRMREFIGRLATGTSGSMKNISKAKTATLPIVIPPNKLRARFVAAVTAFQSIRALQSEAIRQADHLFDTLLHRAFRGEL